MKGRLVVFVAMAVGSSGCSSSEDEAGASVKSDLSAFGAYCKGKLLAAKDVQLAQGPAVWSSNGAAGYRAPAGAEFLVSASFDKWTGYLVYSDGKVAKIAGSAGLVKDTDFTSDCATDVNAIGVSVLLRASTFYAQQDLSGEPCTLPVATEFKSFSFSAGSPSTVSGDALKAQCALDTSFSDDIIYGKLYAK